LTGGGGIAQSLRQSQMIACSLGGNMPDRSSLAIVLAAGEGTPSRGCR
jgi:hypothetical protein